MSRTTEYTCDRCGVTEPADGAAEWPHFARSKNKARIKADFCSMACFYEWIDARRNGSDLPLFAVGEGE